MRTKVVILSSIAVALFSITIFLPTAHDSGINKYMDNNKITSIKDTQKNNDATTIQTTNNNSTATSSLDNEWWSLGYHPYAFVKDADPKGAPNCDGYKLTYTQSSNYLQGAASNPNGFADSKYGCWNVCGPTSYAMFFSAWEQKPWDTSTLDTMCAETNFNSNIGLRGDEGFTYIKNHHADTIDTPVPNGSKTTDDKLKEIIDQGGFIVFSISNTYGELNPGGRLSHIECVHGYLSKDGKVEYFIVGDPNGGPTYHNIIAQGKTSFVIGEYLYAIKADGFASRNVDCVRTVFVPKEMPTPTTNSSSSTKSGSHQISSVKTMNQYGEGHTSSTDAGAWLPTGCESVATCIALDSVGALPLNVSNVNKFVDNLKKGSSTSGNPYIEFRGNPTDSNSFGCYSQPIVDAVKIIAPGYTVKDVSNMSLSDLCATYIDKDIPVIVWGTLKNTDRDKENKNASFTNPNTGQTEYWRQGEHCMCLIGYDSSNYIVSDPDTGRIEKYPKVSFEKHHQWERNFAVVVYK